MAETMPGHVEIIASVGYQVALWVAIAACVVACEVLHRRAERRRAIRLAERVALPADEWLKLSSATDPAFAQLPQASVMSILEVLAELIDIAPTQLRCTDRIADLELTESYVIDDPWDAYDDALSELVEGRNGTSFVPDPNWETVGDVIKGTVSQMSPPAEAAKGVRSN